jgi:hypothetical protein
MNGSQIKNEAAVKNATENAVDIQKESLLRRLLNQSKLKITCCATKCKGGRTSLIPKS